MCFFGKPSAPPVETTTPAAPPGPPAPNPEEVEVGGARRSEETRRFGPLGPVRGPRLRRDRSTTGGGTGTGGSGISL